MRLAGSFAVKPRFRKNMMTDFDGVVPALGQALTKRGYTSLTPVQKEMLAPGLIGADALVSAQTGSGKTVAFGLALAPDILEGAERLTQAHAPLALVIAPTRELALQVKRELEWLYELAGADIATCVGGMDMRTERRNLDRGAHIVVGTPGRLRDHIERGSLDMTALRAVVLDEADEMLDLGFRDDLEYMLDTAPDHRRTLLFSATVPKSIMGLAKRYQRDAIRIETKSDTKQHQDIEYRALMLAPNDKENGIINVIRYFEAPNTIIFCSTRAEVNHMTSRFNNRGFSVVALSGELSQNERSHALQAMRDGRARVCVATDVAARGIDLPGLELVIHADIPKNKEILLHRSGRTGRAGRKGVCVLMVPYPARRRTERLLSNAQIDATWAKPPTMEEIAARDRERFLNDPVLTEAVTDEERPHVQELLDHHSVEQIAAALVRLQQTGQPVPEELSDTGPTRDYGRDRDNSRDRSKGRDRAERPQKNRQDFSDGTWVSLSVGRKHNAEPRWILPTLCRAGHITKKEIGSIRIHENETHVELAPDIVDQFFAALGPSRKLEKTITVDKLRGPVPEAESSRSKMPVREKRAYEKRGPAGAPDGRRDDRKAQRSKPIEDEKVRSKRPHSEDKPPQAEDKPPVEEAKNRAAAPDAAEKTGAVKKADSKPKAKKAKGAKKKPKWTAAQKRARDEAKKAQKTGGNTPLKRK
ncbi:ATP-dependent RNA helicase DeaD [Kordiimonas lacus]|uniref:ATP-dependent RNA helicase DeaD n=2 Tax=Kordiimonas lacus TaxID=637679 RepID=A0A1G7BN70_9PROT|nr:ATP-dependent RNA helicase DeaD [Kordiimonas lacus]